MDILDRLIGHDAYTTRQLIVCCLDLSPKTLATKFDIGHRTLPDTFAHIISVTEGWTDVMKGDKAVAATASASAEQSLEHLLTRLGHVTVEFADVSRRVQREGREDEMIVFGDQGAKLSYGGIVAHTITHSMHHRAQALYMMKQIGVEIVGEGDVLTWEEQAFGWR